MKTMKKIAALLIFAITACNAAATGNYQDWWWNPALDGMGLNVGQQGDTLVVSWYLYDADGKPTFLTLAGPLIDDVVEGTLWRSSGPLPGPGYDPDDVSRTDVGDAILTFESGNLAVFEYDYDGGSGAFELERFSYGRSDVSGVWDFIASGEAWDCILPVNEGPYRVTGYLSIRQTDNDVQVTQVYDTGEICNFDLTGIQRGSYVDASGTYTCNFGIAGIASLRNIRVIDESLTLGLDAKITAGETCRQQSRVAAVRDVRSDTDDAPPDSMIGPIY